MGGATTTTTAAPVADTSSAAGVGGGGGWYLVSVVDNDFIKGDIFAPFMWVIANATGKDTTAAAK